MNQMNQMNLMKTNSQKKTVTLEDHLVECEDRFQGVVQSLTNIDLKLSRIEEMVIAIKNRLKN